MARNLLSYKKKEQSLQSQSKESEKHQYGFKDRIDHFTWSWFACTMSTGAIAVLLANQPNKFPGLLTIGKIFFILDLVLLIGFSCMITLRFWRNPRKFTKSLHYPNEALFFGAFWVSIALVLNCIELYAVPVCGPWLVRALEVMFWMYAASALIIAIFQYVTLFVAERMPVASAMPAWVFPVYPFLVIGPLAGTLLASQPEGAALPILIGGIMFQGLGWTVACFMYTIYIVRLMSNELPSPPTRPGMFISVGPAGYTAAGLVSLGSYAPTVIPDGFLNMSTVSEGEVIKVIGVVSGIFIWLVAFWFCALSCVSVLAGAHKMSFTLNWWAFIFPNGGLTLAAIQIGNQLRSPAIQGVCSALTLILVILWLFVAASHILAVTKRQILWEGQDEDHGMDV